MLYQKFQQNIEKLLIVGNRPYPGSIALAVSGGSDSIALLMLTHQWVVTHNIKLVVILVNHHLRQQSILEHEHVQDLSHKLGWDYYQLHFDHQNNFANLQARAREARYQLMTELCKKLDILTILTGHHLDDYIENYYLRLEKKSSIFGISSSNIMWYNNVRIVRPLFDITKQQLITYLVDNNIKWFEDESNMSDKYRRNVIRKMLMQGGEDVINQQCEIDQLVKEKLQPELIACIGETVKIYDFGFATIDLSNFAKFSSNITLQVISFVLIIISGKNRANRSAPMVMIMELLQQKQDFVKTLHGCMVKKVADNLIIYREFGRKLPINVKLKETEAWDERFILGFLHKSKKLSGFLGETKPSTAAYIDVREERRRVSTTKSSTRLIYDADYVVTNLTMKDYSEIKQYLDLTTLKQISFNNHIALLFTLPVIKRYLQQDNTLEKVIAIPHISYYNDEYLRNNITVFFSPNFISRFTHFC